MSQKRYKYKINECLDKLAYGDHRKALRLLPGILGIGASTFHNYRNLVIGNSQDIPYEAVAKLEAFFGLDCGDLANFKVDVKPISDHDDEGIDDIAEKFGLSKT